VKLDEGGSGQEDRDLLMLLCDRAVAVEPFGRISLEAYAAGVDAATAVLRDLSWLPRCSSKRSLTCCAKSGATLAAVSCAAWPGG
jgi:hypothetical protein